MKTPRGNPNFNKKFSNFIKSLDILGHPLSLNYKNNQTYKTVFGGIFSIIGEILVLTYFLFQIRTVISNGQTTLTYTNTKSDLASNNVPLELTRDKFDFAAFIYVDVENSSTPYYQEHIDEYFSIVYNQNEVTIPVNNTAHVDFYLNSVTLPLKKCGNNAFKYMKEPSELKSFSQYYYCPEKDYITYLKGYFTSSITKFVSVNLIYCQQIHLDGVRPGENRKCKSKEETDALMPYVQFRIAFMTQYFDTNEFNQSPLKGFIKNNIYQLYSKQFQNVNLKIQQNFAILKDSKLTNNLFNQNLTFLEVTQDYSTQSSQTNTVQIRPLIAINFFEGETKQSIYRQVFTILDALSNTGGFMGTIIGLIKLLVSGTQKNLFEISIMRNLFLVQKQSKDSSKKRNKAVTSMEKQSSDTIKIQSLTSTSTSFIETTVKKKSSSSAYERISLSQKQLIQEFKQYLDKLTKFKFTYRNLISLKIRQCCYRSRLSKTQLQFKKGRQQMLDEFDIVKLIKHMRYQQAQQQIQLHKYQRLFLHYLKSNVINLDGGKVEPDKSSAMMVNTDFDSDDEQFSQPIIEQKIQKLVQNSQKFKIDKRILQLTFKEGMYVQNHLSQIDKTYKW